MGGNQLVDVDAPAKRAHRLLEARRPPALSVVEGPALSISNGRRALHPPSLVEARRPRRAFPGVDYGVRRRFPEARLDAPANGH